MSVTTRTKVKILQHNRLGANSFLLSKTLKANKKLRQYFSGSNKRFRDWCFQGRTATESTGTGILLRLTYLLTWAVKFRNV